MGELEGLFIAEEEDVAALIGKTVHFGEALGKHSNVNATIEEDEIEVISEDQEFITKFIEIMGDGTVSGYNPLDYLD